VLQRRGRACGQHHTHGAAERARRIRERLQPHPTGRESVSQQHTFSDFRGQCRSNLKSLCSILQGGVDSDCHDNVLETTKIKLSLYFIYHNY
jgi:hypothetical protein